VRAFAKTLFRRLDAKSWQTMGEAVLGMRIVKAFNLEDEMRQRMDKAIRVVERSANRMARGGAAATLFG